VSHVRIWIVRLTVLSLVLAGLLGAPIAPGAGSDTAGADVAYAAKIEPAVWQALAAAPDGRAQAVIAMQAEADLSFAARMDDWNARGWAVYHALRATADGSQARVLEALASAQRAGHVATYQSFWIVNVIVVRADRAGLLAAAALPEVAQVQAPPRLERDLALPGAGAGAPATPATVEWNVHKIRADDVWATYNVTGTGAVVIDIDTGVEFTHTALVNQYRGNLGGGNFDHNYNWLDTVGQSPVPRPVDDQEPFHGTHTMGTMVGWDGGANQIGVAPGARWIATTGGGEWFDYAPSLAALQFALAPTRLDGTQPDPSKRADAANNSWHGTAYDSMNYEKAYMGLRAAGIFVAGSAGNTGPACGTNNSPNNTPGAFNVGATSSTDLIAGFSSRGPNPFRNGTSPELSAPGVNVRSSVPGNGSDYNTFSGTSMSAPHVAGSVALLISLEPKLRGQVDQLEELLRKTADAMPFPTQTCGGVPGSQAPNNTYGWGRLNVKAAADMIYQAGWLSGTVTTGGNPVPGALVSFSNTAYTYTLTTTADPLGRYRVLAGAGVWDMTAGAYGYQIASANGLTVTQNAVTVQDFALTALPVYSVSGTVREITTTVGIAAYLDITSNLAARPAWAAANGAYSMNVPQGAYTLTVSHPGYNSQSVGITVNGNVVQDFTLTPRVNYTCLDSRDPGGPVYNWIEASDGVPHNLSNDTSFQVTLPAPFTYFGTSYTRVAVGSDGLAQFAGTPMNLPLLYLPFERIPNTDFLVLGEDYDPALGAQGVIYTKTVGSQLILQWQDVQHFGGGNPETFQAILDFTDNSITAQYKRLSWPDYASGGLENSTGSVGQLWNFMNSAHLTNGLAVRYAPASGNAVNWGCDHTLWLDHNPTAGVVDVPGGEVTFRASGDVYGPFGAPGVTISATVPAGTQFVAASPGGTLNGSVITWPGFGNQRARAGMAVWYTVRPYNLWPDGAVIRSLAYIADASGQWRQQTAGVIVRHSGPPPSRILLPAALHNTP
jgi:subtilisin family serine protease